MPISFSQVASLPDILSADRHRVFFPSMAGVDGELLSKVYSAVTLPATGTGHIIIKLLGFSVGHRGGLQFENQMSVTFHEVSTGKAVKSIRKWMDLVRNNEEGTSEDKSSYAFDIPIFVYTATGDTAIEFNAINVYPTSLELPELGETSGPFTFTTQFNVDELEIVDAN